MFYLKSVQMITNGERKFLPLSLFSQLSQDLLCSFKKKSRFVEEVLSQPKSEVVAFPKIEMKWDWVSDVHVYIKSDAVIWFWHYRHVRTRQTSAQRCGANKLATKLELVLLLNEFSHGIFQRFVFMLSTRFVRTSGNNFNCLTKHGATLSSLNISRRTYCSGCDEHACDTIIFFRWKLKNQYLKSIVITFCKKRLSCDRVIKRGLGNLSSQARW